MSDFRNWSLSLRLRLILMNGLLLGLLGGALLYQQISLNREQKAIEGLSGALHRQKILTEVRVQFDDFRYWSMDMVVTQGSDSARGASEARKALIGALEDPALKDLAWTGDLRRHLEAITQHVLTIFDATGDARNAEVARCRARMAAASAPLQTALKEQLGVASEASTRLLNLSRSSARVSQLVLLFAVPSGIFLAWLTLRSVTTPLRQVSAHVALLATGDLTGNLDVSRSDEFGQLMRSLRNMQERMREALLSIRSNARMLTGASETLTLVSQSMSQTANETSSQVTTVQGSSEQMSRNSMAVATAANQMTASIREVARNATRAAEVSASAVRLAAGANKAITLLGEGSGEIGKVVKLINSIAEQTNLLALNATIEAARAGTVGRGFAIVAGEVKELARKTAKATEEIRSKIVALQASTTQAVDSIGQVTHTIGEISETQATIATAVEEQTMTTNEMNGMYTQSAQDNQRIAQSITRVAEAARSASSGAENTRKAAARLSEIAQEQERLIGRFKC